LRFIMIFGTISTGDWQRSSSDGAFLHFTIPDLASTYIGATSMAGITLTGVLFTENGGPFLYAKGK
jgi:hypothetical protein